MFFCTYRLLRRENLSDSQIINVLDDISYDSNVSGASDDSVADTTYQPPGILEQPDDETSDDDVENEGDEDDAPVIPEDANDQPGTSGGDQRPLLRFRFIQPSKKQRVSRKR